MTDIANKVMKEIKEKGISMRPRAYFVAASILLVLGVALAMIVASFLVHLIAFRLRVDFPFDFLRFGPLGFKPFFIVFPWRLLLLAIIFLVFGLILLKKYEFSYQQNFAALAIIVIFAVFLSGALIDHLFINRRLEKVLPIREFYREKLPDENWVTGEILEKNNDGIVVRSWDGRQIKIFWDETTMLPMGRNFKVGQSIRAFGEWKDDLLQIKGILPGRISPTFSPRPELPFLPRQPWF